MTTANRTLSVIILLLAAFWVTKAEAFCLKECRQVAGNVRSTPNIRYQDSHDREKSHNVGDVRNSIVGDVHIQNGHMKLQISDITAKESVIDASINSTVILGDMK